jgi:hypothetical protein
MARRFEDLPPVSPLEEGAPARRRRPKIVGFIGWICAGLGYASFILKGSQLPSLLVPEKMKWMNPDWKPPPFSHGQFTIAVFILLAEMFVGLICMSGGLGCLKLREWGRKLLIAYGIASIILTIAKSAWQIAMFDFMIEYQRSMTTQPVMQDATGNLRYLALIIMAGAQLMWPLIVISILTRRHVKDAFDAARLGDGRSKGWQSTES